MDAIESMDWGAYSNFGFTVNSHPELQDVLKAVYYLGSPGCTAALALIAVVLFLLQGRTRSALVALAVYVSAFGVIESVRILVPRRRPEDAQNILGADHMVGSYPAAGLMLFLLGLILIQVALWTWVTSARARGALVLAAAALTVCVALSQLFLRVHFVTDVLGALAGSALFGVLAVRVIGPTETSPTAVPSDSPTVGA